MFSWKCLESSDISVVLAFLLFIFLGSLSVSLSAPSLCHIKTIPYQIGRALRLCSIFHQLYERSWEGAASSNRRLCASLNTTRLLGNHSMVCIHTLSILCSWSFFRVPTVTAQGIRTYQTIRNVLTNYVHRNLLSSSSCQCSTSCGCRQSIG